MIYTSYFGKMKSFPKNFEPICIARWKPKWYHGKVLLTLAPPDHLLRWWRASGKTVRDQIQFMKVYRGEVLQWLNPRAVEKMIKQIAGDNTPVLVCFEAEGFCHRHIIAQWLRANGIRCEEWNETRKG